MTRTVSLILLGALSAFAFDYHLKPVRISPSVQCFFGAPEEPNQANGGNMVNTCAIDAGDRTVVVDSGPTAVYAAQVVKALGRKAPPVTVVVNTHFHDDHLGGNSYYAKHGASIIGHANIAAHYASESERFDRMKHLVTPDAYGDTTIVLPTVTLDKRYVVATPKGEIQILNLARKGHTDTDTVVYFPKEKIVFAGDLVFNDRIFPIRDASIKGWLEAIDLLSKLDYTILVPGHGTDLSKTSYVFTREYLTALRDAVQKALDDGVDMNAVTQIVTLPQFSAKPLYNELNGKNVIKAYELLEMGEN